MSSRRTRLALIRERPSDAAAVMKLMDRAFGAERTQLAVYRLRERSAPVPALSFVAIDPQRRLRGSIRFYGVTFVAATQQCLLLGPLAVDRRLRGGGVGRALVARGLDAAAFMGWDVCFVVGEPKFYGRFGFTNASALGFSIAGKVARRRFMVKELTPGSLRRCEGGALAPLTPPSEQG